MHEKWQGLFHVLAGGAASALLWGVLRHGSRRARRKDVGSRTRDRTSQDKKAKEAVPSTPAETEAGKGTVIISRADDQSGPLYTFTENELIVHQLLLTAGDGEMQYRDFSSMGGNGAGGDQEFLANMAQQVKAAAEGAFFSLLGEGLAQDPPQLERLASLVLDVRDRLSELVPQSTQEGQALMAGISEKLDTDYVSQRISHGYDPAYLAQLFDYLVHIITQLQAPARRAGTQAKYAAVAGQFQGAVAAAAAARAVATAGQQAEPRVELESPPAAAAAGARVQGGPPAGGAAQEGAEAAGPHAGSSAAPDSSSAVGVGAGRVGVEIRSRGDSNKLRVELPPETEGPGGSGVRAGSPGADDSASSTASASPAMGEEVAGAHPEQEGGEQDGAGVAQAAQRAQQDAYEGVTDRVSVQFVVRESVQTVRLIMRVVQQHWIERHGSSSSPEPSPTGLLRPPSAAPTPRLPFLPALPATGAAPPAPSPPAPGAHPLQQPPRPPSSHQYRGSTTAPATKRGSSSGTEAPLKRSSTSGSGGSADAAQGAPGAGATEANAEGIKGAGARVLSSAEVAALVAAARLMWDQLSELRSDVARARLSLLKSAITSGSSGLEYERRRYERAVGDQAPSRAMPKTYAWLQQALHKARPAPGLAGAELVQACVTAGLIQLLQRPDALSPADCPETLMLDCMVLVTLQNELQRVVLLVAACLIAQQVLAGRRVALPREEQQELCADIKRRIGVLLSGRVNLEGISVELHHQIQRAMASAATASADAPMPQQPQQAQQDNRGRLDTPASSSTGGLPAAPGASSLPSGASAGGAVGDGMEVVRRMVRRIFSTEDAVYRRVQAGVTSALSALLDTPGTEGCLKILRGISGEAVAEEVGELGVNVHRIATLSAAVCQPFYASMMGEAEAQRHRVPEGR